MWALRDLAIADDLAAEYLLWGIRHPEDNVKINAALAIARRFAGQLHLVDRLVAFIETGPSSATQAAAILALGNGWADAPDTTRLIDWARRQPSPQLRLVGLHLLQCSNPPGDATLFRPEERAWLLSLLRHEDHASGPWPAADLVNIAATGHAQAVDFALETLTTNGRTGGDRGLAWTLACNAFADDSRFKAWVAAELAEPEARGLILYDVGMIPQQWRDDPAFADALRKYVDAKLEEPTYRVAGLATTPGGPTPRPARWSSSTQTTSTSVPPSPADFAVSTSAPRPWPASPSTCSGRGRASRSSCRGYAGPTSVVARKKQVVVARAVADAWNRFEEAVRERGAEGEAAREVLAAYDPAELAALCTAVNPHHLMWHTSQPSSPLGRDNQRPRSSPTSSSTTRSPSPQVFRTPSRSRSSERTAAESTKLPDESSTRPSTCSSTSNPSCAKSWPSNWHAARSPQLTLST